MTYEEALKEAYKQPWKVGICDSVKLGHKDDCWCRVITIDHPIPFEEDGEIKHISAIVSQGWIEKELAEHLVNLHNKSLDLAVDKVEDCQPKVSPPTKTIADLTDEQLLHIAELAFGRVSKNTKIGRGDVWVSVTFGPEMNYHYLGITNKLDIVADVNGEEVHNNMYQIYEYLRELNIKPV